MLRSLLTCKDAGGEDLDPLGRRGGGATPSARLTASHTAPSHPGAAPYCMRFLYALTSWAVWQIDSTS
jgi:hypothetical protein